MLHCAFLPTAAALWAQVGKVLWQSSAAERLRGTLSSLANTEEHVALAQRMSVLQQVRARLHP